MIAAIFVFIASWLLPFAVREFRKSAYLSLAFWFVVGLHQLVSFINAFCFTTLGADADAATFHRIGAELAQSGSFSFAIGSQFYTNMLGVLYRIFGAYHLLGEQLSILAFALSCIVLIKLLGLLGLARQQVSILLLFGALPTMVLLGSITMRESYQVLFFMLSVYFGIKMQLKGSVNVYLLLMVIASMLMGLFHHALPVYAVMLVSFAMLWSVRPRTHRWAVKKIHLILVLFLPPLLVGVYLLSRLQVAGAGGAISALVNMDLLKKAASFRESSVLSRATYGVSFDLSTPITAFCSSILIYINYLFAPFPWQINNVLDAYAFFESTLRFILIYYSIKQWRYSIGIQRRLFGLLLILFFSMSFMWAVGTTNYGTAMRHHMLTWWLIVLMGVPLLTDAFRRSFLVFASYKRASLFSEVDS